MLSTIFNCVRSGRDAGELCLLVWHVNDCLKTSVRASCLGALYPDCPCCVCFCLGYTSLFWKQSGERLKFLKSVDLVLAFAFNKSDASSVTWVKRVRKAVRNGLQFLTAVMARCVGPSQWAEVNQWQITRELKPPGVSTWRNLMMVFSSGKGV